MNSVDADRGVRKRCNCSVDLIKLFTKVILKGLDDLSIFGIGRHSLIKILYSEDIVWTADAEKKKKQEGAIETMLKEIEKIIELQLKENIIY